MIDEIEKIEEAGKTDEAVKTEETEMTEETEKNEEIVESEKTEKIEEFAEIYVPHRKRIVAVDDSNVVLKTLKNVLDKDYELHPFSTGARALEYLEQKDKIPDLIILDIEMPIMNGYDVLARIKKMPHVRHIPVIFLTSHSEKTQVMKAVTGGVDDYVVKPIDKEVLALRVKTLLNK